MKRAALLLVLAACGTNPSSNPSDSGAGDTAPPTDASSGTDSAPPTDGGVSPDAGGIPTGGTVLFQEKFDDASFASRGWYDSPNGTITTTDHAPGSTSAFECDFAKG